MKIDVDKMVEVLFKELETVIKEGSSEVSNMDLTRELGFSIEKIIYNDKTEELTIITPDRPEKSAVIGKGGWVVGRLREELGIKSIHVEACSDMLIRIYRMELALKKINSIIPSFKNDAVYPLENIKQLLDVRIKNLPRFNFQSQFKTELSRLKSGNEIEEASENKAIVALSGGVDSSFSLIIAKLMGFNPLAVTVDPGNIILPSYTKNNIDTLTSAIDVPNVFIEADLSTVIEDALKGNIHPCGRCSKAIEAALYEYVKESGIPFLIFGDFLATGYQSIVDTDGFCRINLPAMLSASKGDTTNLASYFKIKSRGGYGCPLINEVHRLHPHMRRYSIQRILRETRAGVLEPGQALNLIVRTL